MVYETVAMVHIMKYKIKIHIASDDLEDIVTELDMIRDQLFDGTENKYEYIKGLCKGHWEICGKLEDSEGE